MGTFISLVLLFSSSPLTSSYYSTVSVYAADVIKCTSIVNPCVGTIGDDSMRGDATANTMFGLGGNDRINAGPGDATDKLSGDDGNDKLIAGDGDDFLNGGEGDDIIYGGRENDVIEGSFGNDILRGGPGDDDLNGGPGADTFWCGTGFDKILDFSAAQGDITSSACEIF